MTRIGDLVTLRRGTTYKSALLGEVGPALLGLATIEPNGGFRRRKLKRYAGESPDSLLVRPGNVYVSLKDVTQTGDLLGAVARLPTDVALGRLTQDTVRLDPIGPDVNLGHIYWHLRTPEVRAYCRRHATGTTTLGLPRASFLAIELPPLTPALRHLLEALESIEATIESNRRLAALCEEFAAALFRSWFVDFDPVRARAAGETPVGVPDDVLDLFPDRLVDSELGPIPEGWSVEPVGEVLDIVGGSTPSTKEPAFWDGPHAFATPKDLSKITYPALLATERTVTDAGMRKVSSRLLPAGTVLLSSRAPIGYTAIAELPVVVNQGFIAARPGPTPSSYVLGWLRANLDSVKQRANGTTFQEISKKSFRPIPILVPPAAVLDAFDAIADPLHQLAVGSLRESRTLAELRDTLLPELISGRLRVPPDATPKTPAP